MVSKKNLYWVLSSLKVVMPFFNSRFDCEQQLVQYFIVNFCGVSLTVVCIRVQN